MSQDEYKKREAKCLIYEKKQTSAYNSVK